MKTEAPLLPRQASAALVLILTALAPSPSEAAVQHVIQISVDGLRGDQLKRLVDAAPESFPAFVRLQTEGAFTYNARCDYDYSVTVPNHATMVTGRPVAQPEGQPDTTPHGFDTNFPRPGATLHADGNPNLDYIASVFDVVHDHGLSTAYYADKTRLEYIFTSYSSAGAPDLTGEDNGSNKIDFSIVQNGGTQDLISAITANVSSAAVNYTFVHITDPDGAGHASGWLSLGWDEAVLATDDYVRQIFEAIDATPALEGRIAITVTGDHGGGGGTPNNHTDATFPENYVIPFFVWGPGVQPGADLHTQFMNRTDPGPNRPDYNAEEQPIRGGDAANLSLAFLGLPPIPGSFIHPEVNFSGVTLQFSRDGDLLNLTWPDSGPDLVLEWAQELKGTPWQRLDHGIINDGTPRTRTLSTWFGSSVFFRLRTPTVSITRQPQPATVHSGANVILTVTTDAPGPMSYQWRRDGVNILGENQPALSFQDMTSADTGDYSVMVSHGADIMLSETATVTVLLNPVITAQPQSQSVSSGASAIFTVAGFGAGPLSYQWRLDGIDIPDATTDTIEIENVQAEHEGVYTVVVSDRLGATVSDPASLIVPAVPRIVQQPQAQTVNVGDTVTFTVVITGNPPPFTYRWRRNNLALDIQTTDERTSSLTLTNVQTSDAGRFDVIITNPAFTAPGTISDRSAVLTVLEP